MSFIRNQSIEKLQQIANSVSSIKDMALSSLLNSFSNQQLQAHDVNISSESVLNDEIKINLG